jgi:excinuclease ABC subunit C
MQLREGVLIGRQDLPLRIDSDTSDGDLLSGFLKQYYNHMEDLASEIYLPSPADEMDLLENWLSNTKGARVRIITPQIGEKYHLVVMAEKNARLLLDEMMIQKRKYTERVPESAAALQKALRLNRAPLTISCFDISNLGAADKAASLVYFERGKPKKSEYRHFKIKTVEGQDDFAAMQEVVSRYVDRRLEDENPLPDLMMVDGGKGQLSVARAVLDEHGLSDQPVIGLAKRLEEVFVPGQSEAVHISKTSPALNLLKRVRDEAHRFAITYHRKLRGKRTVGSELDKIPGVGPARRSALLKHFGSVKRIKEASTDDLASVESIPKKLAAKIHEHFASEKA